MIKSRLWLLPLLFVHTVSWAAVFDDTLPGINTLRNQMRQLNACAERYIASIEIRAATTGGDLSSAVNFEIGPSEACRLVVAETSSVTPDGILTIKTPTTTASGLSVGLTDQTIIFYPMVETSPAIPYSRSAGPVEIKTWRAQYTPGIYSSLNLKTVPIFGTESNLIAQIGIPISLAAG
jgi:hypothetical protein